MATLSVFFPASRVTVNMFSASTVLPFSQGAQALKTQVYIKVAHERVPPTDDLCPRLVPPVKHHRTGRDAFLQRAHKEGKSTRWAACERAGTKHSWSRPVGAGLLQVIRVTGSGPGGRHRAATPVWVTLFSSLYPEATDVIHSAVTAPPSAAVRARPHVAVKRHDHR